MSREGQWIHNLWDRRATSSPFFFLSFSFLSSPVSFSLPLSLNRKHIFKMDGPLLWAYHFPLKAPAVLEVRRTLWSLGGRGSRTTQGLPWPKCKLEKAHCPRWAAWQGSRLDFSPLTPPPAALVQDKTYTDLSAALGVFLCWSSVNHTEPRRGS